MDDKWRMIDCKMIRCPNLRGPIYHAGFTRKSGEETWWSCLADKDKRKYLRNIKKCPENRKILKDHTGD